MPNINISVNSFDANSSANGNITDPLILQKVNEVIRHLQGRSFQDPEPVPEVPAAL